MADIYKIKIGEETHNLPFLPLSGGTMSSDAGIKWPNSTSATWDTFGLNTHQGIKILNTIGKLSTNAPNEYAVGLSVSGYYGFCLAYYGGGDIWWLKGSADNNWKSIIHSDNIGSQSVNYANTAGGVSWNNVSEKPTSLPANGGNADTIGGYGPSNFVKRYTYTIPINKSLRIEFGAQFNAIIYGRVTLGGGSLILIGNGYGENRIRNSWTQLSKGSISWSVPASDSYSKTIEIQGKSDHPVSIEVISNATPTFTEITTLTSGIMDNPVALVSEIPTNNNQLTNGAGYITGITSTMVTNALGYTPYNSTNPNGYITSSGSITGNAATSTISRYLETKYQSDDKWYGDSYKAYIQWETPTIAKLKVDNYLTKTDYAITATNATNDSDGNAINTTYLKKSGGVMSGYISWQEGVDGNDVSNWLTERSNYGIKILSAAGGSSEAPSAYSTGLQVKGRYGFQIASQGGDVDNFFIRNISRDNRTWKTLIHSDNIGSYALTSLPSHTHTKSEITDFPTSLPASDVYSWAKASSKPSYKTSEVAEETNLYFTNQRAINACSGTYLTKHVSTSANTDPFIISRSGSTSESLRIGIDDTTCYFFYENDELLNNFRFTLKNTDIESGNKNGNESYVVFTGDSNGSHVSANYFNATQFNGPLVGNVTGNCSGSSGSCTGNAATSTSANYSKNLLGRNTNGSDYGATDGNLIFAEWNTHGDNRWCLKAKGYETRVGYANDSDKLDGIDSTGFFKTNLDSIPTSGNLANIPSGSYWIYENKGETNPAPATYSSLIAFGKSYYSPQLCVTHNAKQAWLRGIYNTSSGYSASDWNEISFKSDLSNLKLRSYTHTLQAGKATRITYSANALNIVKVTRNNGGAQLILIGTGYGAEGTVRNTWTELTPSSWFQWSLPQTADVSCAVEVYCSSVTGDIEVFSSGSITFTDLNGGLTTAAYNKSLIHTGNIGSYALTSLPSHTHDYLPLGGGTLTNSLTLSAGNITVSAGSVSAKNGFFETSDERLKDIQAPLTTDLEKLSHLRKVYFNFKEDPSKTHIGVIAQDIKELYPEIVNETDKGTLNVDYSKLSVIVLDAIDILHKENMEIKKENEEIKKRLEKLESLLLNQ